MTTLKSLLLGGAAALAAMTGAEAADLPVKAKAAEYVKVCAAYGAGYYYIPGTDTCLKVGGYARLDAYVNASALFNPLISNQASPFPNSSDTTDSYRTRVRGMAQLDARTKTDYGVLRSYISVGADMDSWQGNDGQGAVFFDLAFIQFAGLTAGYAFSFYGPNVNYMLTIPYTQSRRKVNQLAYTAQFGNGLSATVAMEDGRQRAVLSAATAYAAGDARGGDEVPDFVGVLRLDQSWGFAQIAGAAHESRVALGPVEDTSSNVWGWAINGTLMFKLPMLAKGDGFFVTAAYADGAANFAGMSGSYGAATLPTQFGRWNAAATGSARYMLSDVVSDDFGNYDTTAVWSVSGQFRHFWTPAVRSAVLAGYASVDAPESNFAYNRGYVDFDLWQVGFNTIWSPVKNLDIGGEILYTKIDGSLPYGYLNTANVATTFGGSAGLVSGGLRIERRF